MKKFYKTPMARTILAATTNILAGSTPTGDFGGVPGDDAPVYKKL